MICIWRFHPKQVPDTGNAGRSFAISEEAVVADTALAFWQKVDPEPVDELCSFQRHGGVKTRVLDIPSS